MSKRLKLATVLMALAMTTGTFTGCGGNPAPASSTAPSSPASSTASASSTAGSSASGEKINVGPKVEFLLQYAKEKKTLYKILDEFEEEYGTELVIQNIPNMTELLKQLNIMVAGGNLPDVVDIDSPYLGAYVKMGVFADLTDRVTKELSVDQYYEGPLNSVKVDGKFYGMPFTANCAALYYNKDMFQAAGIDKPADTWDGLLEQAKKLTKDGVYGFSTSATATMDGTFRYYPLLWANGGSIEDLNSEANVKALKFFKDLVDAKAMNPEVTNWAPNDSIGQFVNGNVAMAFDGSWQMKSVTESAKFDWDVATLPKGTATNASTLGGHAFGVIKDHNEDGGWALVKWFQDPERMRRFNVDEGYLPARKDVRESTPEFKEGKVGIFAASMEYAMPRGPRADWPEVENIVQPMLQSVIIGAKTPEQAAADAATAMAPILAKK